jgi:hypothetical protein
MRKSIVFAVLLIVTSSLLSTSCKEKEEIFDVKANLIEKVWVLKEMSAVVPNQEFDQAATLVTALTKFTFDFNENDILKFSVTSLLSEDSVSASGSWKINDDFTQLTIDDDVATITSANETRVELEAATVGFVGIDDEDVASVGKIKVVLEAIPTL